MNHTWPAPEGISIKEIFPQKHILKCVDDSLRSLQTDCIDLMLFHVWIDEFSKDDEWKEVCNNLTRQGKVKFWGLSPNYYKPDGCLKTLESGPISVVQCIFNIYHQRPITGLFSTAHDLDIGIIACVPLDEGGLTGNINRNTKFPEGDFRVEYFKNERLEELVRRTSKLKKFLGKEADTLPELALRFILSFNEISAVIPGMRRLQYVESGTAVSDGRKLSPLLLNELKKHTWERNFYPWVSKFQQWL